MADLQEHNPYEALSVPGYLPYVLGAVLASVGLEIQALAVGWEIFERTGSYQLLGFTGLAQFLPVLLFALPAGHAADQFNRRKMFQCALVLSATASLALAWLSWNEGAVELIFVCLIVSGTSRAISMPARASLLSQIVPRATLPNAVAWNATGWQIANVSGPALGGFVLWLSEPSVAYLAAAAGSLCCVGLLFLVYPHRPPHPGTPPSLTNVLAGVRFVWNNELLLAAISLDLFAVLLGGATSLLPAYAKDILKIGAAGLGVLRAAPALGAVLMAVAIAHFPPRKPGLALLLAVALFGVATIAFGLSTWWPVSFAALLLTGAFDNVSVVVRGTLAQVLTPDSMRGRVSAVNSLFITSSNELGAYESGQVAAWFGPVASVVGGGIGTILIVIAAVRLWPRLLTLGPLRELRPEIDTAIKAEAAPLAPGTPGERGRG